MTHRKRAILMILALLIVVLIRTGVWCIHASDEQAQKNTELIAAIKRLDVKTEENVLDDGADANATDTADTRTFWQRIWGFVFHRTPPANRMPALALLSNNLWENYPVTWKQGEPMLSALIKHGADPNLNDDKGSTLLMLGCASDDRPLVQMALAHGAKVNAQTKNGDTPLMIAAFYGNSDMVQILLAHGANVNSKSADLGTALLVAIYYYRPSSGIVKMLLDHGDAANVKADNGDTPLRVALQDDHPDLVEILLEHGAAVNVKYGFSSPLKLAAEANRPDLVSLLKRYGAKE